LVNEVRPGPPGNGRFLEARDREESTAGFDALERGSRYEAIQGELKRLTQKAGELEGILSQWDQDLPPAPDTTIQAPKALAQGLVGQYLTPPGEEREVENLLTIFEGCLHQGYKAKAPATTRRATPPINQDQDNNGVRLAYAELPPKDSLDQQPELIEATMRACLQRHPDLAGDPLKIQMIHYCFKNYVNIDPAMSDLTLQERLERASQMAREFLGMRGPS